MNLILEIVSGNTAMMFRRTLLIFTLLALAACARPPLFERDTAKQVVGQARELQAEKYAPTEYQAALQAFADGRSLMDRGQYGSARDAFNFALEHARRAVNVTNEAQAREIAAAAERARQQAVEAKARQAEEETRRRAAEKARQATETAEKKVSADTKSELQEPEPEPEPDPEPKEVQPVDNYLVGEGETLWTIADHPTVYGDGNLWPLLYQANRDQIKDPRQIFPGQTLSVRRDLTPTEIEEAREKGKASDIFPLPQ